ncbi:MAG TPA: hypothetical protein VIY28_14570 [Pseudonocardiaceae bacterium]
MHIPTTCRTPVRPQHWRSKATLVVGAFTAAFTPAAIAEVKAAAAQGPQGLSALISRLEKSAPAATTAETMATTRSEYALALALASYTSDSSTPSGNSSIEPRTANAALSRAHNSCWHVGDQVGERWTFTEAGKAVAWIEEDHNYWCGNGYSISQNGLGFYHRQWQQFPFCLNVTSDLHGWDGPHSSWAHGGIWASQGMWTPWGTCGTYQSGHAALRIAANGHFDHYNDY